MRHEVVNNNPSLWECHIKAKPKDGHKYDSGHVVMLGGMFMTGAVCLAAHAAMRIGAGICSIVSCPESMDIYRLYLANLIVEKSKSYADFASHISDPRRNTVLMGSGAGLDNSSDLKKAVIDVCNFGEDKQIILDADALSVFEDNPQNLFNVLHKNCILTPHEGEFERIFPNIKGTVSDRARMAAKISGAVIVLKGARTIIASPCGKCVANTNACAELATAGSGDVLAGMIAGLSARGVAPFEASCGAVWIHGEIAIQFGGGLIATDIPDMIPDILHKFY